MVLGAYNDVNTHLLAHSAGRAGEGVLLLWLVSPINPVTPGLHFHEDGSVSKSLSWPPDSSSCFSMKQAAVTHGQWTGELGSAVLLRKTYKANLRSLHSLQNK